MKIISLAVTGFFLLTPALAQDQSKIDSLRNVLAEMESRQKLLQDEINEIRLEIASLSAEKPERADCEAVVNNEVDQATGVPLVSAPSKPIVVSSPDGRNVVSMSWLLSTNAKKLTLVVNLKGGSPCIDPAAEISFQFKDGTRQAIRHSSGSNCDGKVNLEFFKTYGKRYLDMLSEREISRIRVRTSKSSFEANFPAAEASSLKKSTACIREMLVE